MNQITEITTSAPGKIYLMGEHAVVHGKPGLLTAIDKRCKVNLSLNKNTDKITIIDKKLNLNKSFSQKDLIETTQTARHFWQEYDETKNIESLKKVITSELDLIKIAIIETYAFYGRQLPSGFTLTIDNQIPMGSGLGSSAALSISIVAAINGLLHVNFNLNEINDIAYIVEQRQHGLPSGADNTITAFGGLLWFRKESPLLKSIGIVPLEIPKQFSDNFILVQTGKPEESTGEMVAKVRNLSEKNPILLKEFLDSQEKITRDLLEVIKNQNESAFKNLIKKGEENLEKIGVVSPKTQDFIRKIEKTDSVAKISGAGGYKNNSGILLVYSKDLNKITNLAKEFSFETFKVNLGVEGVKIETN